jgi:hypothetical protein
MSISLPTLTAESPSAEIYAQTDSWGQLLNRAREFGEKSTSAKLANAVRKRKQIYAFATNQLAFADHRHFITGQPLLTSSAHADSDEHPPPRQRRRPQPAQQQSNAVAAAAVAAVGDDGDQVARDDNSSRAAPQPVAEAAAASAVLSRQAIVREVIDEVMPVLLQRIHDVNRRSATAARHKRPRAQDRDDDSASHRRSAPSASTSRSAQSVHPRCLTYDRDGKIRQWEPLFN